MIFFLLILFIYGLVFHAQMSMAMTVDDEEVRRRSCMQTWIAEKIKQLEEEADDAESILPRSNQKIE